MNAAVGQKIEAEFVTKVQMAELTGTIAEKITFRWTAEAACGYSKGWCHKLGIGGARHWRRTSAHPLPAGRGARTPRLTGDVALDGRFGLPPLTTACGAGPRLIGGIHTHGRGDRIH
ncbi:hypothetical protein AB0H17_27080 [Streptomyces olivoreticuli]